MSGIGCGGGESDASDAGTDAVAPPLACTVEIEPEAELPEPERYTPRWAFEPWISKDISDRADTLAFVEGFRERDIPVGAVVLDSPWDVQYTTFRPNPARYGDFASLVETLHQDGVRVVLWTTAFVNQRSFDLEVGGDRYEGAAPNFAEGRACGFFVNDARIYVWWKGRGASVDFFDARARAWWHAQQDFVLDLGIDGWKLDFGESYLERDEMLPTEIGEVPHQRYSEEYYRDFLAYGVSRRGREFTTMVRAWDESYDRRGRFHARPEHAPVAWMGDNRRDWVGIVDALDHAFRSANAGYVVLGSDVGGYLDRDDQFLATEIPFDLENFQRWTAWSGMMPFMQLHGRGNLAPWTVPGSDRDREETVALWRYWATLHHAMVPFWYSLAEEAYAGGPVIVRPIGETASEWAGDWRYLVGEAFLVAPLIEAGSVRDVALPSGARWYDWWQPAGDALEGGTMLAGYDVGSARERIPLFVREGAIVPMHVEGDANALGSAASAGFLTVLVWPAAEAHSFRLRELPAASGTTDPITTITAQRGASETSLTFAPARASVIARVRAESTPASVEADGSALPARPDRAALDSNDEGYWYDAATRALWVKRSAAVATITVR